MILDSLLYDEFNCTVGSILLKRLKRNQQGSLKVRKLESWKVLKLILNQQTLNLEP